MVKRWYYSASHWRLGDVMVVNITFLSFLLFSMCLSMHDAVSTCINCSFFFTLILILLPLLWNERLLSVQCNTSHGTEYKITLQRVSVSVWVCVCAREFGVEYREKGCRYGLGHNGARIGNGVWGVEWSRDRWRHVTLKGQVVTPKCLGAIISKTARNTASVTTEHL